MITATPSAAGLLQPGTILRDTYLIHDRIATGGMGEVHLATHVRLPGKFAIKVLSSRLARDPRAVARFCREAAIVSVLRHPNVVLVYDFDVSPEGLPYLVMECLEGNDLAKCLTSEGPMTLARVAKIVNQIASALQSAHVRGIIHRDLKPANVMLVDCEGLADFVKVLDFGVSKVRGGDPSMTGQWTMLGTPSYMAPEQAEGRSEDIDGRTDQFSLAVLAYVLLTGADPFPGHTTAEVLNRIVHEAPVPLVGRVPYEARAVEAVLFRAMSKQSNGRYPEVLEFAHALNQAACEGANQLGVPGGPAELAVGANRQSMAAYARQEDSEGLSAQSTVVRLRPSAPPFATASRHETSARTEAPTFCDLPAAQSPAYLSVA